MGHWVTHPGHQSIKPAASHLQPFTNVLRLDTFSLVASFPSEFLRSTSRSAHRSDRALPTRVSGPLRGIIAGRPRCQLKGRLAPTLTAARCRGTRPNYAPPTGFLDLSTAFSDLRLVNLFHLTTTSRIPRSLSLVRARKHALVSGPQAAPMPPTGQFQIRSGCHSPGPTSSPSP